MADKTLSLGVSTKGCTEGVSVALWGTYKADFILRVDGHLEQGEEAECALLD